MMDGPSCSDRHGDATAASPAALGAAAAQMRYVAVRMKQGVLWPVVSYREFADDPLPTPPEMLAAVEWLVGDWVDESEESRSIPADGAGESHPLGKKRGGRAPMAPGPL